MGIFNDFFVQEKPFFTGIARGFGFGGGGGGASVSYNFQASGGTKQTGVSTPDGTFTIHTFLSDQQFII